MLFDCSTVVSGSRVWAVLGAIAAAVDGCWCTRPADSGFVGAPAEATGAAAEDEDNPGSVGHTTIPYAVVNRLSSATDAGGLVPPCAAPWDCCV